MNECPACVDEAFIVQQFPTLDIAGCCSVKVRTALIDQLCGEHRKERERIDSGIKTPFDRLVDSYPLRWFLGEAKPARARHPMSIYRCESGLCEATFDHPDEECSSVEEGCALLVGAGWKPVWVKVALTDQPGKRDRYIFGQGGWICPACVARFA